MLHLFLEEKQKIELICRKSFEAVGADEEGFACSETITNALTKTLRLLDVSAVDDQHIERLVDEATKQNTGRVNASQFTSVVRKIFV